MRQLVLGIFIFFGLAFSSQECLAGKRPRDASQKESEEHQNQPKKQRGDASPQKSSEPVDVQMPVCHVSNDCAPLSGTSASGLSKTSIEKLQAAIESPRPRTSSSPAPTLLKVTSFKLEDVINASKMYDPKSPSSPQLNSVEDLQKAIHIPVDPLMTKRTQQDLRILSEYQVDGLKTFRELVANAIDSHFYSNATPQQPSVEIASEPSKGLVHVEDHGSGMDLNDIVFYLLSPGRSRNSLLSDPRLANQNLTGRFGMGFFSVLSLLKTPEDSLVLRTKKAGKPCIELTFQLQSSEISLHFKELQDDRCPAPGTKVSIRSSKIPFTNSQSRGAGAGGALLVGPHEVSGSEPILELVEEYFKYNSKVPVRFDKKLLNQSNEDPTRLFTPKFKLAEGIGKPIENGAGHVVLLINGVKLKSIPVSGINIYPTTLIHLPYEVPLTPDRDDLDAKDPKLLTYFRELISEISRRNDLTLLNSLEPLIGSLIKEGKLEKPTVNHALPAVEQLLDIQTLVDSRSKASPFDLRRLVHQDLANIDLPSHVATSSSQEFAQVIADFKDKTRLVRIVGPTVPGLPSLLLIDSTVNRSGPLFQAGLKTIWENEVLMGADLPRWSSLAKNNFEVGCVNAAVDEPEPGRDLIDWLISKCSERYNRVFASELKRISQIEEPNMRREEEGNLIGRRHKFESTIKSIHKHRTEISELIKEVRHKGGFSLQIGEKPNVEVRYANAWLSYLLRNPEAIGDQKEIREFFRRFKLLHPTQDLDLLILANYAKSESTRNTRVFEGHPWTRVMNRLLIGGREPPHKSLLILEDHLTVPGFHRMLNETELKNLKERGFHVNTLHEPDWLQFLQKEIKDHPESELDQFIPEAQHFYYNFCFFHFSSPELKKQYYRRCLETAKSLSSLRLPDQQMSDEIRKSISSWSIDLDFNQTEAFSKMDTQKNEFAKPSDVQRWLESKESYKRMPAALRPYLQSLFKDPEQGTPDSHIVRELDASSAFQEEEISQIKPLDGTWTRVVRPIQEDPSVKKAIGNDPLLIAKEYYLAIHQNPNPWQFLGEIYKNMVEAGAKSISFNWHREPEGRLVLTMGDDGKGVSQEQIPFLYLPKLSSKEKATNDINFGWGFFTLFKVFDQVLVESSIDGKNRSILLLKLDPAGNLLISRSEELGVATQKGTRIHAITKFNSNPSYETLLADRIAHAVRDFDGKVQIQGKWNKLDKFSDLKPLAETKIEFKDLKLSSNLKVYSRYSSDWEGADTEFVHFNGRKSPVRLGRLFDHLPRMMKYYIDMAEEYENGFFVNVSPIDVPQSQGRTRVFGSADSIIKKAAQEKILGIMIPAIVSHYVEDHPIKRYDYYYDFRDMAKAQEKRDDSNLQALTLKTDEDFENWANAEPLYTGGPTRRQIKEMVFEKLVKIGLLDRFGAFQETMAKRIKLDKFDDLLRSEIEPLREEAEKSVKKSKKLYFDYIKDAIIEEFDRFDLAIRGYIRMHNFDDKDEKAFSSLLNFRELKSSSDFFPLGDLSEKLNTVSPDVARKILFPAAVYERLVSGPIAGWLGLPIELKFFDDASAPVAAAAFQGQSSSLKSSPQKSLVFGLNIRGPLFSEGKEIINTGEITPQVLMRLFEIVSHELVHCLEAASSDTHNPRFYREFTTHYLKLVTLSRTQLEKQISEAFHGLAKISYDPTKEAQLESEVLQGF